MPAKDTAVVTGATRGIGRCVAIQLRDAGYRVVATGRGADRLARLEDELGVETCPLDVTDEAEIRTLAARIVPSGLDVLVNNAGASFDGFDEGVARRTLATNFFGARAVTEALLPQLREGARIVMVSSGAGTLSGFDAPVRDQLLAAELDEAALLELARSFPEQVGRNEHSRLGWPSNAYKVSKALLNAYTRLLAARLASDGRKPRINAVCPGWVRTDMGGSAAPRSVEQGAESVLWAARLGPEGPSGGFFRDGQRIDW